MSPILRQHPFTKEWVIFASERDQKPTHYGKPHHRIKKLPKKSEDPFAEGNEHLTLPEIDAFRSSKAANTPGWTVRVVPNKYPALEDNRTSKDASAEREAQGHHEVLILSPDPLNDLAVLPDEHAQQVLQMVIQRLIDLGSKGYTKFIQVLGNHGEESGASLAHPHWQILSLPFIPQVFLDELKRTSHWHREHEKCFYCSMLEELPVERVIMENNSCIAFSPYAPKTAFETWVFPKQHHAQLETMVDELDAFARILKLTLQLIKKHLNYPAYTLYFSTLPEHLCSSYEQSFHCYAVIKPIVGMPGGLEAATGVYINTVTPEEATRLLKEK